MANGAIKISPGAARRDARLQQLEQFGLDDAVVQEVLKKIQARRLAERQAAEMSKGVSASAPPPKKSAMKSDKISPVMNSSKDDSNKASAKTAKISTKAKKTTTTPMANTSPPVRKNAFSKLTETWIKRKQKRNSTADATTTAVAAAAVTVARSPKRETKQTQMVTTAELPVEEQPVDELPVEEQPVEELPVDEQRVDEQPNEPVNEVPEASNEPTRKYIEEFEVVPPDYAQRSRIRSGDNSDEMKTGDEHSVASDDGTELTNLTDLPDDIKAILTNKVLDADRKVNRDQYEHDVDNYLSQDLLTSILEEYFCNGCANMSLWEEEEEKRDNEFHDTHQEKEYHEEHEDEEKKEDEDEHEDEEEHDDKEEHGEDEHKDHDDDINKRGMMAGKRSQEVGGVRSLVASRLRWRSQMVEEFDYHEPAEYDDDSSVSESEDDSDDDSSQEEQHHMSKEHGEFIHEEPPVFHEDSTMNNSLEHTKLVDASVHREEQLKISDASEGSNDKLEPKLLDEGERSTAAQSVESDVVEGMEIPFQKEEGVTEPVEVSAAFAAEPRSVSQRMKSFFQTNS